MFMRDHLMLTGTAVLSASAMAKEPPQRNPQLLTRPHLVRPTRAAQCEWIDGRVVMTSDWVELGTTTRNPPNTYAYDAFESDAAGAPTDDAPFGCTTTLPPGNRWYFGSTHNSPFWSNDMTTDAAGGGVQCQGLNVAWWWRVDPTSDYDDSDGDLWPDQDCYISVFTSEDFGFACEDDGLDSLYPGVTYLFPNLDGNDSHAFELGYFYANIDLGGTSLIHLMPADGVGGTIVMYGTAYDPDTGEITLTAGAGDVWAQPMLWGTDEDEPPGGTTRIGTQEAGIYVSDPDNPTALVCADYSFNVCPEPLAPSVGFLYKGIDPCPCTGDVNADGVVDSADLAALLARFGSSCPCPEPCVDDDGNGIVNIADLANLLSAFGTTCP